MTNLRLVVPIILAGMGITAACSSSDVDVGALPDLAGCYGLAYRSLPESLAGTRFPFTRVMPSGSIELVVDSDGPFDSAAVVPAGIDHLAPAASRWYWIDRDSIYVWWWQGMADTEFRVAVTSDSLFGAASYTSDVGPPREWRVRLLKEECPG